LAAGAAAAGLSEAADFAGRVEAFSGSADFAGDEDGAGLAAGAAGFERALGALFVAAAGRGFFDLAMANVTSRRGP
jgi:hypothetical protein